MSKTLPPPTPHPRDAEVHTVSRFGKGAKSSGRRAHGAKGPKPKRSWQRKSAIALISLLAFVLLGAGGLYAYAQWRFSQLKKIDVAGLVPRNGNDPFNILLVGSDSRDFVNNAADASKFGSSSNTGGQRSDVIIVARVAPALHAIRLLSIPRDTYVNIPGNSEVSGPNRINAAFNGGPELLVRTITQSFGIPISDYAEVGFPGFAGMVDSLGGINLDFPYPVRDAYSQLAITATGCQLVKGPQALALVRSRHLQYQTSRGWISDPSSDFSRIQRQDAFFQAVVPKLRGVVTSPTGINGLLSAMTSNVTIDRSFTQGTLLGLSRDFKSADGSPLAAETLPTISTVIGGASVLIPAAAEDERLIGSFLAFGGSSSTTTTAFHTPSGQVIDTVLTASSGSPVTVTTLPNRANPNNINFNTQSEPWNPKPCQQ